MEKRFGRFYIDRDVINSHPKEISMLFSKMKMVVVRAEMILSRDAIEYTAYSPFFEIVPEGQVEKEYEIIAYRENNKETGKIEYRCKVI